MKQSGRTRTLLALAILVVGGLGARLMAATVDVAPARIAASEPVTPVEEWIVTPETLEAPPHGEFQLVEPFGPDYDPLGIFPTGEAYGEPWTFQILPDSLIYTSYLAGGRESRFATYWNYDPNRGWYWDVALGGRVGILRYGTQDGFRPRGWQFDIEGAAFPRLDLEDNRDLISADFRFGMPLTFGYGRLQTKFAYYHLSSHLGDEYLEKNPTAVRINYSRDVFVLGASYDLTDSLRIYSEVGWAFYTSGGSEPWEAQFGIDYSSPYPTGFRGAPFFAVNGRIREEVDWGGNVTAQVGWQWRGDSGTGLLRTGFQYFNGKSDQYQFFDEHEELLGWVIWYDY